MKLFFKGTLLLKALLARICSCINKYGHFVKETDTNDIKPGSNSISTLLSTQKLYVGAYMICVRCIYCLYNIIAKGIRLLDKMAIFVYTGNFFIYVRAIKSNAPFTLLCDTHFVHSNEKLTTGTMCKFMTSLRLN